MNYNPPELNRFVQRTMAMVIVLLSCLLCSCIAVKERPDPPVAVPKDFSSSGHVPSDAQWWLDFQDPALSSLIDRALSDNFNLLVARDRITEAQAIARKAGALLYPSLDGGASAVTTRNHSAETTRDTLSLEFAASYEIDLWGRLRSFRDATLLEARATEADYHTAAISLSAEMARTWYQLVSIHLQRKLLIEQRATNRKVLELISAQFRAGQAGIADVLQQRQLIEGNSSDIDALYSDMQLLEYQLAILLGVAPGMADLPSPDQLPALPPLPDTGIPLDLIAKRPDIQSDLLRLQAADYRVASAVADRLPKLSISASISDSSNSTSDLFNNWFSSLGANLFGPIFDGGQRKAEVARTEAVASQYFYGYGQTILEAIAEVENGLVREKKQLAIIASLEVRQKLAAETIVHVGNRYRQGAEDYQRVLLALISHQDIQRAIVIGTGQLIDFRIALYRSLSGTLPESQPGQQQTAPSSNTTNKGMIQ